MTSPAMVALRMASRSSSTEISSSPTNFSRRASSTDGDRLDQVGAVRLGVVAHVRGDLLDLPLGAQLLVEPDEGLHGDQVDHALVVALGADRQLEDGGVGARGGP